MGALVGVRSPALQDGTLELVNGSVFGRYPKISAQQVWNCIISDDALAPFAGYKRVTNNGGLEGRSGFNSQRLGKIISVIDNGVYVNDTDFSRAKIGSLETFSGNVTIAENNRGQIGICDMKDIWIYDWVNNTFTKCDIDFIPSYLNEMGGYLLATIDNEPAWRYANIEDGSVWPTDNSVGLQLKSNNAKAVVPLPGRGETVMVMGTSVAQVYSNTGSYPVPFTSSAFTNIDYGVLNSATIAVSDKFVVWLGINEKSGIALFVSDGGQPQRISTDGINYFFANLSAPQDSYGFLFMQDGHLIYQFTFTTDNRSLIYDFNTQKFFNVSDPNLNYHIAKKVFFFNNKYYFLSINDGDIYEFSSNIYTMNNEAMVHMVLTKNLRDMDAAPSVIQNLNFIIEQGQTSEIQAVDCSVSRDGGVKFGSAFRKYLNPQGYRKNRLNFWNIGRSNDTCLQFKFWSKGRFLIFNGVISGSK